MSLFARRAPSEPLQPPNPSEDARFAIENEEVVLVGDPLGQIAEQYRRLRTSLQALNPDGAARSILVTSAVDGEGKSVSAVNLGIALAELPNLSILVIDGDFVNPSVEDLLGLPRRQGLSEVLQGELQLEQALRHTAVERFDIIGAGAAPRNPADVLNTDRIRAVLNMLKRRYDFILVDTPAVLSMNHSSVVGAIVDGILLVVRLGHTPKPLVEEAFKVLENLGGNVLGTITTGAHEPDVRGRHYR